MILVYTLDEKRRVVPELDFIKWAVWMEEGKRQVAREQVGNILVSTIFIGVDHSYHFNSPPLVWETMCFKDGEPGKCERCSGEWEDAEKMHARILEQAKKGEI